MKLSKVIIFRDNFAFKLSKRVFKGISLVNNILRLFKKDRINAFYQRVQQVVERSCDSQPSCKNIIRLYKIIFGDNK